MKASIWFAALAMALPAAACGDDGSEVPPDARPQVPDVDGPPTVEPDGMTDPGAADYAFQGPDGQSNVSYSGQVLRWVEIAGLSDYLNDQFSMDVKGGAIVAGTIQDALNEYYDWQGTDVGITISTTPAVLQTLLGDITMGDVKNLAEKIAGAEGEVQHNEVIGWMGTQTPDALVQSWFAQLDTIAAAWQSDSCINSMDCPADPFGNPIGPAWVTEEGQDLRQLIAKFLIGAVPTSQATGDYLATILMEDNTAPDGDGNYTVMEHHWDEGFGYFGAARDYGDYTLEEIDDVGYADSNSDAAIDLLSEYNFSLAGYAAGRDLGSAEAAKTNFAETLFSAFVEGRRIVTDAKADGDGALTAEEMTALEAQRDLIVATWEKVLAANVIHYINETLGDMEKCDNAIAGEDGTTCSMYEFAEVAEHWSELKGFALALEFIPTGVLVEQEKVDDLHVLLRDAPAVPEANEATDVVTSTADVTAHMTDLETARDMLGTIYGFDPANVEGW